MAVRQRRGRPRPVRPLRSPEEKAVRDAVLQHLLSVASYADHLPGEFFLDYPPMPDHAGLTAALARPIQVSMLEAADDEIARLQAPGAILKAADVLVSTGFDRTDPRALDWAQQHAADLVTAISEQQRISIRNVIATAFDDQVTGPQTALRLRSIVGLHPRYAQAVDTAHNLAYRRNLKAGMSDAQARDNAYEQAIRYRNRLINSRAEMIARTEIQTAQNRARQLAWTQQVEDGHLSPYSRKRWVAHDSIPNAPKKSGKRLSNPCRICAGLHGTSQRWDQPWPGGYQHPPAHPNCRCVQVVLPPGLPGDDDYLNDLSTPTIDQAIADSKAAWDGFNADQPIALSQYDGAGAVARRRIWKERGDAGEWAVAHDDGTIVPTQRTIDAVGKTQRAGALVRKRAELRAKQAEPDLWEKVQEGRRKIRAEEARVQNWNAVDQARNISAVANQTKQVERQWARRVADEVTRAVQEHRSTALPFNHGTSRIPAYVDRALFAEQIPDSWKRPNTVYEIRPAYEKGTSRAHADPAAHTLWLDGTSNRTPEYGHEMLHVIAYDNPVLQHLQWGWLGSKIHTTRPLWHPLRVKDIADVVPGYTRGEMYLPDANTRHPYAAKVYGPFRPDGHSEVLAMAYQQHLEGFFPNPGQALDPEIMDLLIGALVSL